MASSAEKRLYPVQTDMHYFVLSLLEWAEKEWQKERRYDLFGLVHTVTLLGYSDGTFAQVASSAEKRLYPVQTDMHYSVLSLLEREEKGRVKADCHRRCVYECLNLMTG